MTLGQFLLLVLIVVVVWVAFKMKKSEQRLDKLEGRQDDE
jgi:septation ring formation regulator EzrA